MLLTKVAESIIKKLKHDPAYRFDAEYSETELIKLLYYRGKQVLRGFLKRRRFKEVRGVFFCGKNVVIEHGNKLRAGRSLIVESGVYLNCLSRNGITLGDNVTIAKNSVLTCTGVVRSKGEGISIGNNTAVGAQSFLSGQGGIALGNDVIMGPGVRIFSENHQFADVSQPIRLQGEQRAKVTIGDDCWIGSGVTILAGVNVGRGSVIAAGAVVTKDVPEYSVIAGVPAAVLKSRIQGRVDDRDR